MAVINGHSVKESLPSTPGVTNAGRVLKIKLANREVKNGTVAVLNQFHLNDIQMVQ